MRYSILTLSVACATESQIIHDGECDAVPNASEPVVYVNQCPEVNLSCPDIPECPDVNVTCPEPQVVVELINPEPNVNVNVEAPNVTVTNNVEAPDFSDLITAIEDLAFSSSGLGKQYHAQTGIIYNTGNVIFTNSSATTYIMTSLMSNQGSYVDCEIWDANGNIIMDDLNRSNMFAPPTGGCCGGAPMGYNHEIRIPIEPGEYLECSKANSGQAQYVLQGYYQ